MGRQPSPESMIVVGLFFMALSCLLGELLGWNWAFVFGLTVGAASLGKGLGILQERKRLSRHD